MECNISISSEGKFNWLLIWLKRELCFVMDVNCLPTAQFRECEWTARGVSWTKNPGGFTSGHRQCQQLTWRFDKPLQSFNGETIKTKYNVLVYKSSWPTCECFQKWAISSRFWKWLNRKLSRHWFQSIDIVPSLSILGKIHKQDVGKNNTLYMNVYQLSIYNYYHFSKLWITSYICVPPSLPLSLSLCLSLSPSLPPPLSLSLSLSPLQYPGGLFHADFHSQALKGLLNLFHINMS